MYKKSRYEKISLWAANLAMKKSRYKKSRYETSLWKNLAMKIRYMKHGVKTVVKKIFCGCENTL